MFRAVVHDLTQCPGVQLLAPLDPALLNTPLAWPANLTLFPVAGRADEEATLDRLAREVDAALVIAPESEDLLWRRCRRLEELDVPLLGPSSDAVRLTGDKRQLAQVWQNAGVPTPVTPLFSGGRGVGGEGFLLPSPGTPGEGSGVGAEGQATTMIIENPSHGPHPQPLSRSTGRGEQDGPHPQPLSRSTGRGEQDGPHPPPPGREGQDNPLTSNPSPPGEGGGKDSPSSFVTYPCVLKPRHGAGSQATFLVRDQAELEAALNQAGAEGLADEFVLQPFVPGRPASVAFLLGPCGRRVLPAAWQLLSADGRFHYLGGELPLPPNLNDRAAPGGPMHRACFRVARLHRRRSDPGRCRGRQRRSRHRDQSAPDDVVCGSPGPGAVQPGSGLARFAGTDRVDSRRTLGARAGAVPCRWRAGWCLTGQRPLAKGSSFPIPNRYMHGRNRFSPKGGDSTALLPQ